MQAEKLISQLKRKLDLKTDLEVARLLGVSAAVIAQWRGKKQELTPLQAANAIVSTRKAAVKETYQEAVRPIVEFFPITKVSRSHRVSDLVVLDVGDSGYVYELCRALKEESSGLYIFYDTRGKALYAGQTKRQNLWTEINLAFNRTRNAQIITAVSHPSINVIFKPANQKVRQPKKVQLKLHDLAAYFSAYAVVPEMVDDLEALLIRAFPNDLLNDKKEKFGKAHRATKK